MSYRGSAIATLSAYALMMLLSYFFGRKYYPIPYNLNKIGLYLVLSTTLSFISFYAYRTNYLVGIAMLFVFLGIVIHFEKNLIRQFIKR
jgi:hypothetical protein